VIPAEPTQRENLAASELNPVDLYGRALELARAAGQLTGELVDRARLTLRDADDRVTGLEVHPSSRSR